MTIQARVTQLEKHLTLNNQRASVQKGYAIVSPDDWDGETVDSRPAAVKGYQTVSDEERAIHDEHE